MHVAILLHSTTGNTRLVARYARAHARRRGHECHLVDVGKPGAAVSLDGVDLLGVACPTLYFRPSLVMERAVARMAVPVAKTPAFLLATCGGDPGAHFQILAHALRHKDVVVLGALSLAFQNNWPVHRAFVAPLAQAEALAEIAILRAGASRSALSLLWPDVADVSSAAPARLVAFLDEVLDAAQRGKPSGWSWAPRPVDLPQGPLVTSLAGRLIQPEAMRRATDVRIVADLCSRCGTCVLVCPVGCIARTGTDDVPVVGEGCTGCWACFNRCPDGAIAGFRAPAGVGRYGGPSARARALFPLDDDGGAGGDA
jgi:Pyruvate/2-oxoacid:ferredoxin oxidoreductase delta subunit